MNDIVSVNQPSDPRFTNPSWGNALTLHTDLMHLAHHDISGEILKTALIDGKILQVEYMAYSGRGRVQGAVHIVSFFGKGWGGRQRIAKRCKGACL